MTATATRRPAPRTPSNFNGNGNGQAKHETNGQPKASANGRVGNGTAAGIRDRKPTKPVAAAEPATAKAPSKPTGRRPAPVSGPPAKSRSDEARVKAFEEMSPKGRKLAKEYEERRGQTGTQSVLVDYDLGADLTDAHRDEANYGAEFERHLAVYLALDRGEAFCRNLRTFAGAFPRDVVQVWTKRPMAGGAHMSLAHWVCLSRLKDPQSRLTHLKTTVESGYSVRELEEYLSTQSARQSNPRAGNRKPKPAPNPLQTIAKGRSLLQTAYNYLAHMPAALAALEGITKDQADLGLFDTLVSCRDYLYAVHEATGELTKTLATGALPRVAGFVRRSVPDYKQPSDSRPAKKSRKAA